MHIANIICLECRSTLLVYVIHLEFVKPIGWSTNVEFIHVRPPSRSIQPSNIVDVLLMITPKCPDLLLDS